MSKSFENTADISWLDLDKPMVALSFDDGPVNPVNDQSTAIRIQNAFAKVNMHATFFYWGNTLNDDTRKELIRAKELGFELANHTKSHPALTSLSKEEMVSEIRFMDDVLSEYTGKDVHIIRPPFIAVNDFVFETINAPLISCGLDTRDWDTENVFTEDIKNTVIKAEEEGRLDGKIVLLHETHETTAEAVEFLVPYLVEKGYQLVNISELFKARGGELLDHVMYGECLKK